MADVYSADEGRLQQRNTDNSSSENAQVAAQEYGIDLGNSNQVLNAAGRYLRPDGPALEAQECEEECGTVNAAVPQIKIKEEQEDEDEYIEVSLDVAGEDCEEPADRNADLSSRDESTDVKLCSMRCQDCGQQFAYWEAFKNHLRQHVEEEMKLERECKRRRLVESVVIENGDPELKKIKPESSTEVNHVEESFLESSFQTKSSKIFMVHPQLTTLPEEEKTAHSYANRAFVCSVCGKVYSSLGFLRNHQKSHVNQKEKSEEFPCKECGKSFARPGGLAVHMRYHKRASLATTSLHCKQCSKKVLTLDPQDLHKETPFQCHKCTKDLDKHLLAHNEKKRECRKSFQFPNELRHHHTIHTSSESYTCNHKPFSQTRNVKTRRQAPLQVCKGSRELRGKKAALGGTNVTDHHVGGALCPAGGIGEDSDDSSVSESSGSTTSTDSSSISSVTTHTEHEGHEESDGSEVLVPVDQSPDWSPGTDTSDSSDSSSSSSSGGHLTQELGKESDECDALEDSFAGTSGSSDSSSTSSAGVHDVSVLVDESSDSSDFLSDLSTREHEDNEESDGLSTGTDTSHSSDSSSDSSARESEKEEESNVLALAGESSDSFASTDIAYFFDSSNLSAGEHEEELPGIDKVQAELKAVRGQETEGEWQCFECGAYFFKEPELHMHYMKHASGEI